MGDERSGRLAGQRALVTGASGALGRACALRLASEGATVAVHYHRNFAAAQDLIAAIAAQGGRAVPVSGDLAQGEGGQAVVDAANAALGGLDILVNNAGITRDALILRMRDEQWDEVLDTNLRAVFVICRRALRDMLRRRHGRIINVSSVVGIVGNAGQTNYAAAKAGLIGFSRALAKEVATRGITANVVAPGFVVSPITDALSDDLRKTALQRIPLQRFGQPSDIASAVAFLASADADYVTGQVITVDGGLTMG